MFGCQSVIFEMEATVARLGILDFEQKHSEMPYMLGKLAAYTELLFDMVETKLSSSTDPSGAITYKP